MLRTSIATVSLSGDLSEKLKAIAAAGFQGVEIFENDFLAFDAGPTEVGTMVRDTGLTVVVFQPFRDFEGLPEPQRTRTFDRAERKFDVMQALGTDLMLVCSNLSPMALGGIDRAAADFHDLGERAARRGLRVGFEALAWGRHVNDHRDAWEIVRRADHPAVGLVLDSFHTLARAIDPESIRRIPGDRVFLVQVADAPKLDMDLLSWSRHFRNMPGQGSLPVVDFLAAVEATGYQGYLSLEIFNDQFRAGSARTVAIDGRRSLIAAMDDVARRRHGVAGAGSTALLPDRAFCLGVEFIEFAVDEDGATRLARLFAALGFLPAGRHLSKEVTWWRQGNINFVINAEKEGFAHASYLTHGLGVCAIGLKVENAAATVGRAKALLAKPFTQPVAPGELEIPAIRGVGGSLLYFVDRKSEFGRVWEVEFEPLSGAATSGGARDAGLTTVDHVAQSMEYDEMLSWLLFYATLFDLERTPALDVADPAGLVRSQVVQTSDGSLRIALNGSQSHRTLSGRFLSEFFGSGVQHIALATGDIIATASCIEENGLRLLQIPDNYYDDLEARFALAPNFLEGLRRHGILYDRDDDGEYFQLYVRSLEERFFIEIVERRGRYRGFGAANASIRLAAQTRSSHHPATD
ncbi:MAG: bifunctional sugar phosphate isomerase/epimerase/4-hydroxyphenylpyruvate dioxygenase family protein [Kiloniellales bacterium]